MKQLFLLATFSLMLFQTLLRTDLVYAAAGPPTEEEVKASITKSFNKVYIDETWHITKIKVDFSPMKFGKQMLKQMQYGKAAEPVWPVRVVVSILQYKDGKEDKTVKRGDGESDVFFFYMNAFDEWDFKTGSL